MTTIAEAIKPPPATVGPIGWLRKNLFNTWYNALLTVVLIWLLYVLLRGVLTWVFVTADWSPVTSNPKLFMVGQYPSDEIWRVGLSVLMVSFLFGLSWGVWGGTVRTFALVMAVGLGVPALLPVGLEILGLEVRLWLLANPALVTLGYLLARTPVGRPRWAMTGWLLSFVLTLILLRGFQDNPRLPLVGTGVWGGLLLTFLLALVGIVASLPLGVLLALGRRSNLPVVKIFSILFIELVRGVPLVSILFMAQVIL
ncbi:MAG: amino acid ABC transporter permease, partial [Anaerolineae bacterium]